VPGADPVEHGAGDMNAEDLLWPCTELALMAANQAVFLEGRRWHDQALAECEGLLESERPDTPCALNNLASLLQATNRLSEAEPLMHRALVIDEASCEPEHPNVAQDFNNLAAQVVYPLRRPEL
jgi:hypothetical protein